MKMKKLGALLLAGVMTMSTLLTGCGNGASGSSAKYIIMKKLLTDFSE